MPICLYSSADIGPIVPGIGSSEQQPIEIVQCERIGVPDANVSDTPIPALKTPVSVGYERSGDQRVGAQDTRYRYAVMSGLYTQSSLSDSNMASGEEQGPSS
jgi:hypothetical protein